MEHIYQTTVEIIETSSTFKFNCPPFVPNNDFLNKFINRKNVPETEQFLYEGNYFTLNKKTEDTELVDKDTYLHLTNYEFSFDPYKHKVERLKLLEINAIDKEYMNIWTSPESKEKSSND